MEALSPELVSAVVRKTARAALEGNVPAAKLVFDLSCGRPAPAAPDPEPLPISLPSMKTGADCGKATNVVMGGMCDGTVPPETGKVLIEGINTQIKSISASTDEERIAAAVAQRLEGPPVPPKILWLLFRHFRATGGLPEDLREARAVVEQVKKGRTAVEQLPEGLAFDNVSLHDCFVPMARAKDPFMDELLDEAVNAHWSIRFAARLRLRAWAKLGEDLTAALCEGKPLPKYGTVGLESEKIFRILVKPGFEDQAKRLESRIHALRERLPQGNRAWFERLEHSGTCFWYAGELPADALMREAVLVEAELDTLVKLYWGWAVHDVMKLFNVAATTTGDSRDHAIQKIQEMARTGSFISKGRQEPPASSPSQASA